MTQRYLKYELLKALVGKKFPIPLTQALSQDLNRLDEWSARNRMFLSPGKNPVHAGNSETFAEPCDLLLV